MTPREAADAMAPIFGGPAGNGALRVLIDHARAVPTTPSDLAELVDELLAITPSTPGWLGTIRQVGIALRAHRCTGPEPEIVSDTEAERLPAGSIVVWCDEDGTPGDSAVIVRIPKGHGLAREQYRVLYRAPESPLHPIVVGSVVPGERAMDHVGARVVGCDAQGRVVHGATVVTVSRAVAGWRGRHWKVVDVPEAAR